MSQVCTLTPDFTAVTLKKWAYSPQIAEIGNFLYKFDQKGYTPLSDFTKFGLGEGLPSLHPQVKFYRCDFKICGLTATKIAKIGNFWYIFAQRGISPLAIFVYKIWHGETKKHHTFRLQPARDSGSPPYLAC